MTLMSPDQQHGRGRFWQAMMCFGLCAWASTQGNAAEAPQDIVISGERVERARQEARLYLGDLGVRTAGDPVARWLDPICPNVIGLSRDHSLLVEERLRKIIADARAPLARRGCASNFNIVFTDSGRTIAQKIARQDSRAFQLQPSAVRELTSGTLPIRWWYNSDMRSRDGQSASDLPFPPGWRVDGAGVPVEMRRSRRGSLYQYNSSGLSSQVVRAISFATVIVDVNLASGRPLSSTVDFAALTGLAEVKLGAIPRRSILSLFEPDGETHLTNRDRSFLKALYRIPMDRSARQQKEKLAALMTGMSSE